MKKIGFLVNDLNPSQLSYFLIKNANEFLTKNKDYDIYIFYDNLAVPCLTPNFAIMQAAEAFSFDGTLIATNLNTASKLINFPSAEKKYFYVWDLDWMRMKNKSFDALQSIYGNKELSLIARSDEHKQAIENAWNAPVKNVISNFDMSKFSIL